MFPIRIDRNLFSKSRYFPLVIGLTVSVVTLVISTLLENQDNIQIKKIILTKIVAVESEILGQLEHRILALERMAKRWEARGGTPQSEWEEDARTLVNDHKGYQAIEWVDSSYYVRWIIPKKGNEAIINLNAGFEPKRRQALEAAKNRRSMTITRPIDLVEGDKGFLAYFPLFVEPEFNEQPPAQSTRKQESQASGETPGNISLGTREFDGFILGVFKIKPLLDKILQQQAYREYGLTVFDEDEVIYNTVSPNWELKQWSQEETFNLYGVEWRIKVVPSPKLLASVQSPLPEIVMTVGLILGWSLALVVYSAQTAKRHALQLEKTKKALQITLQELKLQKLALDRSAIVEITDPEGKITYVNDKFCQISQYNRDEIIGKTHHLVNSGYHSPVFFQKLWSTITNNQVWQGEIKNRAKDGTFYWVNTTIVPFFDSQNKPFQYLTIRFDITTRKQGQEKLEEQNLALLEAKQQAETANRAKSEFLATMSHELRTPLNSILGFTQILQKEPDLTSVQQRFLDSIRRSGQHLLTLINDILDLSKIAAQKLQLKAHDFLLRNFLADLTTFIDQSAQNKGLSFNYKLISTLPQAVSGDETRLRQVLINLLGNAVKFTETGSVTFKVGYVDDFSRQGAQRDWEEEEDREDGEEIAQSSTVRIPSLRKPQQGHTAIPKIRFQVEDTGVGIPPDKLKAIFSPFEQLPSQLGYQEGTGLGLAISSNLVQLMGSQIQIESTPGKGSIFWFDVELPSVNSANLDAPTQHQLQPTGFCGPSRKILVVDDNVNNRQLLVNWLQPLGFELAEAENGQQGLTKAQILAPDVILLDLRMPVMDGREMLDRLRQHPNLRDTIVFMISANSQLILKPEEIDCHAFLSKPVALEKLLELLETHLQLEWIFPESTAARTSPSSEETSELLSSQNPSSALVAPPESELIELLELNDLGDMKVLEERIQSLKASDSQYDIFAREVQQLAATCQQDKLENFLKNFISN